ncbi:MAG: DUF445 domain-containing protein [Planctomycetota bacterium]|jgi:ABC-type transporter Mla subunit MlaD
MNEASGKPKKKLTAKMIQARIQKSVLKGFQYILNSDALGKRIDEKVRETLGGGVATAESSIDQSAINETVGKEIGSAIEDLLASPRLRESIDGVLSQHTESTLTIPPEVVESVITSRLEEILTSKEVLTILEPVIEKKVTSYVTDQIRLDDTTSLVEALAPTIEHKVLETLDLIAMRDSVEKLKTEVEEKLTDAAREHEAAGQMHDMLQQRMVDSEALQTTMADLADALEKRADAIADQLESLNTATDQMIARGIESEEILSSVRKLGATVDEKRQQMETSLSTLAAMNENFESRERDSAQIIQTGQELIQRMEMQTREHDKALSEIEDAREEMESRQADATELLTEVAGIRDDVTAKQIQLEDFIKELSAFRKEFNSKASQVEAAQNPLIEAHAEINELVDNIRDAAEFLGELKERLQGRGEDTLQSVIQMIERASPNHATIQKLKALIGIQEDSEVNLVLSEGALENAEKLIEEIDASNSEIEDNLRKISELREKMATGESDITDQTAFIGKLYKELETRSTEIRRAIDDFAAEKQDLRNALETAHAGINDMQNAIRNDVLDSVGTISSPMPSPNLTQDQMNQVIQAVLESVTVTFGKVERSLQAKLAKSVTQTREEIAESVDSAVNSETMKSRIASAIKMLVQTDKLGDAGIDVDALREGIITDVLDQIGTTISMKQSDESIDEMDTSTMAKPIDKDALKAEILAELGETAASAPPQDGGMHIADPLEMELMIKTRVQKLVDAYKDDMAERLVDIVDQRVMERLQVDSRSWKMPTPAAGMGQAADETPSQDAALQFPDPEAMEIMIKERVQKLVEAYKEDMAERLVDVVDERVMSRLNIPTPEEIRSIVIENVHSEVSSQMSQVPAQGGAKSDIDIASEVRQIVDQQFKLIQEYLERESIPKIIKEILSKMPRQ